MNVSQIIPLVLESLNAYATEQSLDIQANENTPLFGADSVLDSMGLVHVIVDIEARLRDAGSPVSLISEQAMSQRNSPFRTVTTLSEFIVAQQNPAS
ncbi:MAG: hypothetical protein ACR2IL_12100 [Chitinophagaceae bacterium]